MKLHFLGTCAGTEPMPNRKHASVVLEHMDKLYWLDAGEACSQTGYLMGLDLLKVKRVLISHVHMDHVGGLASLFWNILKMCMIKKIDFPHLDVYIPFMDSLDGAMKLVEGSNGKAFDISGHLVSDGVLFDDGDVKVTALHNWHAVPKVEGVSVSYSYLIEADEKKIVYSGDVKEYEELDPLIGDRCDAIVIETGHFGIDNAYEYLKNKNVGRVFFCHNGREIINHPQESVEKVQKYFGGKAVICEDATTFELN